VAAVENKTFNLNATMKPKLFETEIRRHRAGAACDEEKVVKYPICAVAAGTVAPADQPLTPSVAGAAGKRLLLVSDDASLGVRLINAADLAGLAFMQANDPTNALLLGGQEYPAVLFLDLDLPLSAGWEAAEEFLRDDSCPSPILMTGRTSHFDLTSAIHAGAIVHKSASTAELLDKVSWSLAQSDIERVDRKARQRLLLRWLKPYNWPVSDTPLNRFWGLNE